MPHLTYQTKTEEVGENLRNMIDDRSHTEQRRRTSEILQVPEEKRENQSDSEPHKPGNEQERGAF